MPRAKTKKGDEAARPVVTKALLDQKPSLLAAFPATVTIFEFAELLGVSPRVVRDYQARNILVPAAMKGRYQFLPSLQNYLASLRASAQGRATDSGPSLAEERAKGEKVRREIEEIRLAQLRGEVLTLAEVSAAWSGLAAQLRAGVLALPSRARSVIPHLTPHDAETLRVLCREVLEALAEEIEIGVVGAEAAELTHAG